MVVYGAKDPLNIFGKRNLENTDMFDYNCGGFALGTFSWYLPCPRHADHKNYFGFLSAQEAEKKTEKCVQFMLAEVPGLRRLRSKDDHLFDDEYMVAFRLSFDGDFHFVRNCHGVWEHKRGHRDAIETMDENEVFGENWCDLYDGPIVLLAKTESGPLF